MGTRIIVNALGLSSYARADLGEGRAAVDHVADYVTALSEGLEDSAEVLVLTGPSGGSSTGPPTGAPSPSGPDESSAAAGLPAEWRRLALPESTEEALLDALASESRTGELLVYCLADTPFLDPEATLRLISLHRDYFAQFTGADGYPIGLLPEILDGDLPGQLRRLAREGAPAPRELFPIVLRDINAFDVETLVAEADARPLRVELACTDREGFSLCRRFADRLGTGAEELAAFVVGTQERLRTVPAFAMLQVVSGHSQEVSYLPREALDLEVGQAQRELPTGQFAGLLEELAALNPGIVVQISLWGEVALHSDLPGLVEAVESRGPAGGSWQDGRAPSLLLESSGVGWRSEDLEWLATRELRRTRIILDLDAADPEVYRSLRGAGFEEAQRVAARLLEAHPDALYLRATRMQENAEDVERFYREWTERTEHVIVQKYDSFAGALPDRRLVDISPVERMPCWHLRRDIAILLDGSVRMCREDLAGEYPLGNVFRDGVATLWERNDAFYRRHVEKNYPEICRSCDEYYTFNF